MSLKAAPESRARCQPRPLTNFIAPGRLYADAATDDENVVRLEVAEA
jgi:hypothetical protein